jgi:hypothetical protein
MADSSNNLDSATPSPTNAEFFSPAYLAERRRAIEQSDQAAGFRGIDEFDPKLPAGHAYAIRTSSRLTSDFRWQYRKDAMDITPQDVIDVLNSAGVKNWVLMGLHGYVGYMPDPRATQDVDVMVPYSVRPRASKAIATRWPSLVIRELSQVTRFLDPADLDHEGKPKPVIDLMHPWSPFQELILKEFVIVDKSTAHRLPTLEAALASKYASMISPHRDRDKKEQDAVDFRRLVRANHERIRDDDLRRLAALIWEGGADDVTRFVQLAMSDEPFPI